MSERRILFVNQFVPPDPSPTARLLDDLATHLRSEGWDTRFLGASKASYQHAKPKGGSRWKRDLGAHARLLRRGILAGPADVVFCLSDPPALLWTARALAGFKRAKLVHWIMDLYPDIAVSLGEIGPESKLKSLVSNRLRPAWKRTDFCVSLDEDMAALIQDRAGDSHILPPWPPRIPEDASVPSPDPSEDSNKTLSILYSGNLGRAHDWRTLVGAMELLQDRSCSAELVFQGSGAGHEPAREAARNLTNVTFQPYVDDKDLPGSLLKADVIAVTQLPSTQGQLWPSKLALARLSGRPILFIGSKNSAIARELRAEESGHGVFEVGEIAPVVEWIAQQQHRPETAAMRQERFQHMKKRADQVRQAGFAQWSAWLEQLSS